MGGALLADAALRAARSEVAAFALIVDVKDEAAVAFYRHHGFELFGSNPRHLFVPPKQFRHSAWVETGSPKARRRSEGA